ncbi:NAD(P)H-hydrate dehydratase [Mucilaginibacter agri]|uniref:Bifunctional NAD(P)H-hydrate repair enzyme n=1 Tax=Mucilaginibacter agri TaxID=2695265 RepID=A0A965ZF13_9SPHI|nr:NAD(P)H-hydrate dehydratase [Mucilaginibacter agri]NCD68789.1 NAD(P)H-hydrate dehydratase [Mucilaginibacter agri]
MQPLLTARQIHEGDSYTIAHEPISSVDLMERAAKAFVKAFTEHYSNTAQSVIIYCGTGNNGGDGLAIARILNEQEGYHKVSVKIARFSEKASDDFNVNLQRLRHTEVPVSEFKTADELGLESAEIIIDALLGNGLNKPLEGEYQKLVHQINEWKKTVVAVDVPTGFAGEGEIDSEATMIKAELTITFQQPKINFLLPESKYALKNWLAVDIGIDGEFTQQLNSPYQYVEESDIIYMLKPRERFSNKGTYGHALIVAGQAKTMGAALLCASACVQTGAGLTTACIPQAGLTALNCYMPEIMAIVREGNGTPEIDWSKFSTMGIGPGLGKDDSSLALLTAILTNYTKPVVVDADALNILAEHRPLWACVPKGSILTPHMKEFDRLFGEHKNWWQRTQTALQKVQELQICIILKNDYTIIATPEGKLYFNSTSNAAMATGGMGDVLTGIITALLAQKYTPAEACIAGVYLHGMAGDDLALPNKLMVVLPEKVTAQLPASMGALMAKKISGF